MSGKQTRKRLDPAERKELILEGALKLFAERHYTTVTVRDIARGCGMNVALIYHYFDDKDHLVRSTLAHAIGEFLDSYSARTAEESGDPLGEIGAWLDANVEMAPTLLRMVKLMADYSVSGDRHDEIGQMIGEFYAREQEVLEKAIRRGIRRGDFRKVDVKRTARQVSLTLDGIFHASASRADDRIPQDIADLADLLRRILGVEEAETPTKPSKKPRRKPVAAD